MKRICFILLLLITLSFTLNVNAKENKKVKVYLFGFDECIHCTNQYEYLKNMDGYNTKFEVVKKDIYKENDMTQPTDNYELAIVVSEYFKDNSISNSEFTGSPYIVISDIYAASGYTEDLAQYIDKAYELGDKDIVPTLVGKKCKDCHSEDTSCDNCKNESCPCYNDNNSFKDEEKSSKKYLIIYSVSSMVFALGAAAFILRKRFK